MDLGCLCRPERLIFGPSDQSRGYAALLIEAQHSALASRSQQSDERLSTRATYIVGSLIGIAARPTLADIERLSHTAVIAPDPPVFTAGSDQRLAAFSPAQRCQVSPPASSAGITATAYSWRPSERVKGIEAMAEVQLYQLVSVPLVDPCGAICGAVCSTC